MKRGLLLFMGALAACAETNHQAIVRLRAPYAAHRDDMATIVRKLPAPGHPSPLGWPASMGPPAVFSDEGKANEPASTAEILQIEDLDAGTEPLFDLSLKSPLHFCLAWTGPVNPLSPAVWDRRGDLSEECEAALRRPWLILIRTVEVRLPELLRLEVFVVHRPTQRVVGAIPIDVVAGHTSPDVGHGAWAGVPGREIQLAFREAASRELSRALCRLPSARIALDGRTCGP